MKESDNTEKKKQSRQEVLAELTENLEQSVKKFMEGDTYKNFLSKMSLFHSYSLNNQLLIALQRPDATLCASYTTWQKQGRYVKKGESGIKIICPSPYRMKVLQEVKDPRTGKPERLADGSIRKEMVEKVIPFYKVGRTFDISQTAGEPLPEIAQDLEGDLDHRQEQLKQAFLELCPVPVHFQPVPGGAHGYYDTVKKEIVVDSSLSEKQALKTLLHEIAHALLHDTDNPNAPRDSPTREVQAESVAYVVCQYFGLDTSEYSFGYISSWSSGKNTTELKESLDVIRITSNDIISQTEQAIAKKILPEPSLSPNAHKPQRRCI